MLKDEQSKEYSPKSSSVHQKKHKNGEKKLKKDVEEAVEEFNLNDDKGKQKEPPILDKKFALILLSSSKLFPQKIKSDLLYDAVVGILVEEGRGAGGGVVKSSALKQKRSFSSVGVEVTKKSGSGRSTRNGVNKGFSDGGVVTGSVYRSSVDGDVVDKSSAAYKAGINFDGYLTTNSSTGGRFSSNEVSSSGGGDNDSHSEPPKCFVRLQVAYEKVCEVAALKCGWNCVRG